MECKKLTTEERAEWEALTAEAWDPELADGIGEDDWWMFTHILEATLGNDFAWLHSIIVHNGPARERCLKRSGLFRRCLRRAYEHGVASDDPGSCCNLANMYHDTLGKGLPEDYARAIELYERGADLGDAQASVNLGYIYYYGRGVEVDYRRAYECYARAALVEGHPEAYWKLGDLYAGGRGVTKSDRTAWRLYSKAYEQGKDSVFVCRAAHHVADYLMTGIEGFLEPDPERALRLYVVAELSYRDAIDAGLTYYGRCLEQAIEGQSRAREAIIELHRKVRAGEED